MIIQKQDERARNNIIIRHLVHYQNFIRKLNNNRTNVTRNLFSFRVDYYAFRFTH